MYGIVKDHEDFPGIGLIQFMVSATHSFSYSGVKTYRVDKHNSSSGYYRYDYQVSEMMLLTTKVFDAMIRLRQRTYEQFSS